MSNNPLQNLLKVIGDRKHLIIQPHDFPDPDAIATAFGLSLLLKKYGIESDILFKGAIDRISLIWMIEQLNIPLVHADDYPLKAEDAIIIVDGCKGNKNVTDLIGDEIAVIDHHISTAPEDVPYSDIRSDYGSCAAVIYQYYLDGGKMPSNDVATALLIGINIDTMQFTRGVSRYDLEAYTALYPLADTILVNHIVRNKIDLNEFIHFERAIDQLQVHEVIAFTYLPEGCNHTLLGLIGDFILSFNEIELVIVAAKEGDTVKCSLRNEVPEWNGKDILQELLKDIGYSGGHFDMAGGIIPRGDLFDPDYFFQRMIELINR